MLSMDNEKDYGKCFFQMSYKEAIRQRIISDYKILTMTVSDQRIRRLIDENRILNLNLRDLDEAEAQSVAAGIALKRVFKRTRGQTRNFVSSQHPRGRSFSGTARRPQSIARYRPENDKLSHFKQENCGGTCDLLREFVSHKRELS